MAWMIYGANGYTGRLIAGEAVRRGLSPVLGGRNRQAVSALADELGVQARVFDLAELATIREQLEPMRLVLHCAGPFSATSRPMLEACIASGTHYLDITGEIEVFEHAFNQDKRARQTDVVLCPGTGFDVVPTDCLAASLVQALPAATHLTLAFEAGGGLSPGTAKTSVEGLAKGGCIRRDGELTPVPVAWKTREIPFVHARRQGVTIRWGDVFTAFVSTGVPNVEVYLSVSDATLRQLRWARRLRPLLRLTVVQEMLKRRVERKVTGPDARRRETSRTEVWGEARSADGRSLTGTLSGPNGYEITTLASLGIVARLLAEDIEGGYYTPSLLMGAGYAASLPGISMHIDQPS